MAEKNVGGTTEEINQGLAAQLQTHQTVQVGRLKGQHCVAVGIPAGSTVQVSGNVGDFCGALNQGTISINGNAGRFCGDCMASGEIVVNGDAGGGAGQYLRGGIIAVKGDCRGSAGQMMTGGTIVVDGSAGREVGKYMMGGEVVIVGDSGERLGENMMGGVIFIRGEPKSLGLNARLSKVGPLDLDRLKLLHVQYRFRGMTSDESLSEFRRVAPETPRPLTGEARK